MYDQEYFEKFTARAKLGYDREMLGQVEYIWSAYGLVCTRSREEHEQFVPRPISMCTTEKHARRWPVDRDKMGKHFPSQFLSHFLSLILSASIHWGGIIY